MLILMVECNKLCLLYTVTYREISYAIEISQTMNSLLHVACAWRLATMRTLYVTTNPEVHNVMD